MRDYIVLDGKRYKTLSKSWTPGGMKPATVRPTLLGEVDVTFASIPIEEWQGMIEGPVTPEGPEWGSISDLRATIAKMQAVVMTDHYENAYDVAIVGQWKEDSLTPMWDGPENIIRIPVRVVKIGAHA